MHLKNRLYLVSGSTYELDENDLKKFPSLIFNDYGYMQQFFDSKRQMYCLLRNRIFFELLVFYIQHGILSKPLDLPTDLYIEELEYYFKDSDFLTQLKQQIDIGNLSDNVEIRFLPSSSSSLKKFLWRSIEYKDTLFGQFYRFIYGFITICSIYLLMYTIVVTRDEHFVKFIEQYLSYHSNQISIVNVTVQFIDYRPDVKQISFSIEMIFLLLWIIELILHLLSAPNRLDLFQSFLFWIDLINIFNTFLYVIMSWNYHREKDLRTTDIRWITLIFQSIDMIKTCRMIQLAKYHPSIQLIVQSFRQSIVEIFTFLIVLLGTSCIFGSLIYTIERLTNPTSLGLGPTVGTSIYYTILAITNVGFEGFLPSTYLGKWIACIAITVGLLTIALPLPLILSPYTRQLLNKNKPIIYR